MRLRIAASGAALCFLVACGESHTGDEDAAIVFDATFPDAGQDGGPPPSTVGAPCVADTDCTPPADYCEMGFPNGYCSHVCATDEDCGAGSVCVLVNPRTSTSICLQSCEQGSTPRTCHPGYGCAAGVGSTPVCIPGCIDDSDCASGLTCDPTGGEAGEGVCYDPDAAVGDACMSSDECPPNARCRRSWPDGSCLLFGCDAAGNTGCPSGAVCASSTGGFGGAFCGDECSVDADCRLGYRCTADYAYPTRRYCNPILAASALGQTCGMGGGGGGGGCVGGICLSEAGNGYPGSYCIGFGCTVGVSDGSCASDGVCVASATGGGLCFDGCALDADCRTGYACRPSDAAVPTSPLACVPACTSDASCTVMGDVCNVGTGRCGPMFVGSTLGQPCMDVTECAGGRCLDEASGWPGGTCTYPGCRLSGTGPSITCASGSVCTDDATGDPTLGVCVSSCTVGGAATCRSGYQCVAVGSTGTEGACRPL